MTSPGHNITWLTFVFILIGLIIILGPVWYYIPALGAWAPPWLVVGLAPGSFTFWAGSFITMTGLYSLILARRNHA